MDLYNKIIGQAESLPQAPEISVENDADITKEKIDLISKVTRKKEEEIRLLSEIKKSLSPGCREKEVDAVNSYLTQNEQNYLLAKNIASFLQGKGERPKPRETLLGKMQDFPAELKKHSDCHYEMILPPLYAKSVKDRFAADGKAIYNIVRFLVKDYEQSHGQIPMLSHPTLIFTHCVLMEKRGKQIPDPDNIDIKSIIDALQGTFYDNDSVLDLNLLITGEISDTAMTRLYIIGRAE